MEGTIVPSIQLIVPFSDTPRPYDFGFYRYSNSWKQTRFTELKPDRQPGTDSKQSSFYFTTSINNSDNPQRSQLLKGYSYFSSEGWIITLTCSQDNLKDLKDLCEKDFLNIKDIIQQSSLEKSEKLSKPNKSTERSTNPKR